MLARAARALAPLRRLPACQQCRALASSSMRRSEKSSSIPDQADNGNNMQPPVSFLKDAEQKLASVFLGIDNPTDKDLQRLTDAAEREARLWLPDPAPRKTARDIVLYAKNAAQRDDAEGAHERRPASGAHFMGPQSSRYYDFLQKLEEMHEGIQKEEMPAAAPSIMQSPWKNKADMEVVVGSFLKSNHYTNLLRVLNDIIADPRCVYVLEELKQYMRRAAVEAEKAKEHTLDTKGRMYATGRRKRSVARVWVSKGTGQFSINGLNIPDYFARVTDRKTVLEPFMATGTLGQYDVMATIAGGGTTGQSSALRHGIALALQRIDGTLRPPLRMDRQMGRVKQSLVTRDARKVERKKPGQKKARKKFAWVKR